MFCEISNVFVGKYVKSCAHFISVLILRLVLWLLTECRQNSLSVTTMTALVERGGILFVFLRYHNF